MSEHTADNERTAHSGNAGSSGNAQDIDPEVLELARAMFDMARTGDSAQLLSLIDHGAPVQIYTSTGDSLLMLAAYHGHAALVTQLAERGADVNAVNDRGQSPLAGAVFKGFEDVAQALIDAGADPDHGTPTARESAHFFGREEFAQMMPPRREGLAQSPQP